MRADRAGFRERAEHLLGRNFHLHEENVAAAECVFGIELRGGDVKVGARADANLILAGGIHHHRGARGGSRGGDDDAGDVDAGGGEGPGGDVGEAVGAHASDEVSGGGAGARRGVGLIRALPAGEERVRGG